jgi:hypothetical protein
VDTLAEACHTITVDIMGDIMIGIIMVIHIITTLTIITIPTTITAGMVSHINGSMEAGPIFLGRPFRIKK